MKRTLHLNMGSPLDTGNDVRLVCGQAFNSTEMSWNYVDRSYDRRMEEYYKPCEKCFNSDKLPLLRLAVNEI